MKEDAKYCKLANRLRREIQSGEYRQGEKIPGENALASRYEMSRQTVRQALGILEQEQVIERRQGSGTYVSFQKQARPRSWNVGVIATHISEYIFPSILRGVENELSENGFSPLLSATQNRVDNERRILEEYLEKGVDGLIVEGTKSALPNPNLPLYRSLRNLNVPVVFFNGSYAQLENSVSVTMDDEAGGFTALCYLADKGHQRIAGLFKSDDVQGLGRYAGFQRGLLERGLPLKDEWVHWFNSETRATLFEDEAEMSRLLETIQNCTALVCYNDEIAVRLLVALQKQGISVPEQLAVISFDNSLLSEIGPLGITSLDHPKELLGACAARKLLAMMEGHKEESAVLQWGFSEKQSC